MIALLYFGHALSDRFYNSGTFVAEDNRMRHWIDLIACDHVGVAHARRYYADQHLVIVRLCDVHRLDSEGSAFLTDYGCPKAPFGKLLSRHLVRPV